MQDSSTKLSPQNQDIRKVSDFPVIPYIAGDGIGPEVMASAIEVVDAAVTHAYGKGKQIEWQAVLAGQEAASKHHDNWLPDETLKAIEKHGIAIKGPLTTPVGKGIRSLNVQIRKSLDLFACVRPVRYFDGVPSVVKNPEKVHLTIFRENTEDIYSGIEFMAQDAATKAMIEAIHQQHPTAVIKFPQTTALGIKVISEEGSKRLIRSAFQYAILHDCPSVTLVHKGNIMKYTEGAFCQWGYELAKEEFGATEDPQTGEVLFLNPRSGRHIVVNDCITDAFFQQVLLRPENYSVVATMNLNGDYISDAVAAQIGGIGIAPGANMNDSISVYEATHGTAPKYVGLDKANPSSLILSAQMMLENMGWVESSGLILYGLKQAFRSAQMTQDIASQCSPPVPSLKTSEFTQAIISHMHSY